MISIYYVYLDDTGEWFTDTDAGPSGSWLDAHEFTELAEAQAAAEQHGGVVFGWVQ